MAVGVSGGKDSRALLELLLSHRRTAPFDYDILALHVVGTPAGLPDLHTTLGPWFQKPGVDYRVVPFELPEGEPLPFDGYRCSWNRRKALFTAAVARGYGKLALAHHADDAAVTALTNLLYDGQLETMAPKVTFFDGAVTLIRPLVCAREKKLAYYARAAGYPVAPACPQADASRRAQVKHILREFGPHQDMIHANLGRAARRSMGF